MKIKPIHIVLLSLFVVFVYSINKNRNPNNRNFSKTIACEIEKRKGNTSIHCFDDK